MNGVNHSGAARRAHDAAIAAGVSRDAADYLAFVIGIGCKDVAGPLDSPSYGLERELLASGWLEHGEYPWGTPAIVPSDKAKIGEAV